MKHVELLIFDLDGTLVTSGKDIALSVNYMRQTLGLPVMEERTILRYVGDGIRKLIERSLEPASLHRCDEAVNLFSTHYGEHMLDNTTLYPGVREMLRHFQDKKKVILTNKRCRFARSISDALDMTRYFNEIVGADSTPYIKPDARLVHPLLERLAAAADRTVMIGDGVNDVLLAKNAGIMSCSFLGGLTEREVLLRLQPDFSYEKASELKTLFR